MADTVQIHIPVKVALYLCSGCGHPKFIFDNPKPPLVLPNVIHQGNKAGVGYWHCGRYRLVASYTRVTENRRTKDKRHGERNGSNLPGGMKWK